MEGGGGGVAIGWKGWPQFKTKKSPCRGARRSLSVAAGAARRPVAKALDVCRETPRNAPALAWVQPRLSRSARYGISSIVRLGPFAHIRNLRARGASAAGLPDNTCCCGHS